MLSFVAYRGALPSCMVMAVLVLHTPVVPFGVRRGARPTNAYVSICDKQQGCLQSAHLRVGLANSGQEEPLLIVTQAR